MSKKLAFQQGDVLLYKVDSVPEGKTVKPKERGLILAEGEVTGHAHRITKLKSVIMIQTDDGRVFLQVKEATPLEHEEHHVIIIEPGEYEVGKVLERDHFSRVTREVID